MADIFTEFDKKFISGDWEAKRTEARKREDARREAEREQEDLAGQMRERGGQYFDAERGRNQERSNIDDRYLTSTETTTNKWAGDVSKNEGMYQGALSKAQDISDQNMRNARSTYQTLSPYYRDAMDKAHTNAQSAMSLADYMDPNNKVAAGVRDLYNTEGEGSFQRYEQQAQNEQRQGLANYGVMSSLGAQAAANAMGGAGPMTVGQQMAQMATANQQAAEGYANTQRRLNQLRDMGMSNREAMRQLGLERGFERTDKAYEAGRLAQEDAARRRGEYEGFEDRNIDRTTRISDRNVSIAEKMLGSRGRVSDSERNAKQLITDLRRGVDMDKLARDTGLSRAELEYLNQADEAAIGRSEGRLAGTVADINQRMAQIEAEDAGRRALFQSTIGGASNILGSWLGGGGGGGGGILGALGGSGGGGRGPQPTGSAGAPAPGAGTGIDAETTPIDEGQIVADAGAYPYDETGAPTGGAYGPEPMPAEYGPGYGLTSNYYSGGYTPTQQSIPEYMGQYGTGQTRPYFQRPTVGAYA